METAKACHHVVLSISSHLLTLLFFITRRDPRFHAMDNHADHKLTEPGLRHGWIILDTRPT